MALARGFDVPIGWFFTPPPRDDGILLSVPDAPRGTDPEVLLDAILGTDATLATWRGALQEYRSTRQRPADSARSRRRTSREVPARPPMIERLRAQLDVRDAFGDIEQARVVLERVAAVLATVEDDDAGRTRRGSAGSAGTERHGTWV